jgi:hypothetical protein
MVRQDGRRDSPADPIKSNKTEFRLTNYRKQAELDALRDAEQEVQARLNGPELVRKIELDISLEDLID